MWRLDLPPRSTLINNRGHKLIREHELTCVFESKCHDLLHSISILTSMKLGPAVLSSSGSAFLFVLAKDILGSMNNSQNIDLVWFDVIDDPVWRRDALQLCLSSGLSFRKTVLRPDFFYVLSSLGPAVRQTPLDDSTHVDFMDEVIPSGVCRHLVN
jgi:hypothetical protein